MNADTGEIYYDLGAIEEAEQRGERLIKLSDKLAKQLGEIQKCSESMMADILEKSKAAKI
jgi:hypothetical protein